MKRVVSFICLALLLLSLVGCKQEESPPLEPVNEPVENVDPPAIVPTQEATPSEVPADDTVVSAPELTPEQREAEISVWHLQNLVSTFTLIYNRYEHPVFYPVGEDTMNSLRDWLTESNDAFPELQFDVYSIEPCVYGYRVATSAPTDNRGYPYYVWFEVSTSDTTLPRVTVVSVGDDGELSYQGAGVDYTGVGIGDDLIQFLNFDY